MSDDYQIEIPPSFYAVYTDTRRRLTAPMTEVRSRYEACEDLANHLVDHGKQVHFDLGVSEDEVLMRCHAGLLTPESGVSVAEATWVVTRLAELLGWEPLPLDGSGAH